MFWNDSHFPRTLPTRLVGALQKDARLARLRAVLERTPANIAGILAHNGEDAAHGTICSLAIPLEHLLA